MSELLKTELALIHDRYQSSFLDGGLLQPEFPLYRCDTGFVRLVGPRKTAQKNEIEVSPGSQLVWHDPGDGQTYFSIYITSYGDTVLIDTFHRGHVEVFKDELCFHAAENQTTERSL
jgi:hypothetical protein